MKKSALGLSLVLSFTAVALFAADGVWSNLAGGNWSTASNWEGNSIANGTGASATFTNTLSGPVVVDNAFTIGLLIASPAAAYTINGDTGTRILGLNNGSEAIEVSVGAGGALTTGVRLNGNGKGLVKRGTGLWTANNSTYGFSGVVIEEGDVVLGSGLGGDGFNVGDNTIRLKAGTSFTYGINNQVNNTAVFDIDAGAVVNLKGLTDNIGGFIGEGVISNFTASFPCRLQNRTLQFSGYAYGTSGGYFLIRSAGTFVLGASDALEQVGYYDAEVTDTVLAFAPGIKDFRVGWMENSNPVTLEDQQEKPVQMALGTSARTSIIKNDVNGRGGLTVEGPASLTVRADASYTGPTVVKGSTLTLGDGITYNGAITNSSSITVMSGRSVEINNKDAITFPNSITGAGTLNKNKPADLTFGALDMLGGVLNVNSGRAIMSGGCSSNLTVSVDEGREFSVDGGELVNSTISMNADGAIVESTTVTLNGGSSENLIYNNNNLVSTLNVTGGDWHFSSYFGNNNSQNFKYTQSGGRADFNVSRCMNNTNRVVGHVSGGQLNIRYEWPPRGLGLKVSGDGEVNLAGAQRLASDGWSHSLILTNDAFLSAETLQLMSKGGAGSELLLELAGGQLEFRVIDNNPGNCDANNTIKVSLNGGTLRPVANSVTASNPLYSRFSVFGGGALMDIETEGQYVFEPTLYSGLSGTEDGGLIKSGHGRLDLSSPMRYTGETVVRGGLLRTLTQDDHPFGSNTVCIQSGEIRIQSGSTGSTHLVQKVGDHDVSDGLSFGSGAARLSLDRPDSGSLTLQAGNSGASQDAALSRVGRGALLIAPMGGLGGLGVNEKFVVNGGLSATNGMVAAYINGVKWGDNSYSGTFLNYDSVAGVIPAVYTSGLGGGSASLAEVTADTSTDSVDVYALKLDAADLTINSGQTLSVGDGVNTAGIILNQVGNVPSSIQGGTLDFGGSEGYIFIGNHSSGHTISSAITGSGGLTVAGYGNSETLNLDAPSGNFYQGDTHILNGRVTIADADGFSTGDLYIYGDDLVGGCFLFDLADTVTNAMHIAGEGSPIFDSHGAVTFVNSSEGVIDAPVELMRDTRVGANGLTCVGRFSQSIYGTGDLEINTPRTDRSPGTIVFGAENSYAGRTIINRGTLLVDEDGTLGDGDVVNQGVLLFNNSLAQTVTNDMAGAGVVKKINSGPLTLSGKVECPVEVLEGSVVLASGMILSECGVSALLDLYGQSITANALNGSGMITNSSASQSLLNLNVAADDQSYYRGAISGGSISVRKSGAGTLVLGGANTYSGDTIVSEGTIRLSANYDEIPYSSELAYHLDASTPDSLTLSGSNVLAWADASANGIDFVQEMTDPTRNNYPFYVSDAINGKGAVRFEGDWNRLYATNSIQVQSVIIVNNKTDHMNLSGIWGRDLADIGIRAQSTTKWQDSNNNDFANGGAFYVNGIDTLDYVQGTPHVLSAISPVPQNWIGAIGDYWASTVNHRSYIGDIGEVAVFKTALTESRRALVEDYLMNKWFGSGESAVLTNVLSEATDLMIEKNGVLDLAGSVQSVASLSGEGRVVSSEDGAELSAGAGGGETTFSGSISGLALFEKTGPGLLTLTGVSSYTGETRVSGGTLRLSGGDNRLAAAGSVTVSAGATFDVNHLSQTLDAISGSGTVQDCNGLVVTGSVAPGGAGATGTLTFDGSPALSGDYFFTANGAGDGDLLVVSGDLDLGSLSLNVEETEMLAGLSYTIVQCGGALSGQFAASNLPGAWRILYDYEAGRVVLNRIVGTLIILR